ncbi:baculovirus DnaJ domain protein [Spodoptera exempta nucleopolyhedrovirus]|uniref:Baculovirus DnaJ domain protein n=1 Tax=Spodoptera exempta nucleopolyhedrovirus TaxID=1242863 RepID=A0A410S858_9ABAC|nr:baculovirus DnaJ domain protein [Spodoptera exempta nucleopolyhedrovirus]QAT90398.1 baculovirus DnaJ domain protein [Spodoptera exempta nucleopolyhedrovirus]
MTTRSKSTAAVGPRVSVASPRAVVAPRKRAKPTTPPSTPKRRSTASTSDESNGTSKSRVVSKLERQDSLYFIDLDKVDYYTILNVNRNSTKSDIIFNSNNLNRIYKKPMSNNAEANSLERIQKVLGDAILVLSNPTFKRNYNYFLDEKIKVQVFHLEKVMPLQRTTTQIYNDILRLKNDSEEFFEMNIGQILIQNVYDTIERNTKNKYFKSTKTNRLRVEWQVGDSDVYDEIDEEYLTEYFKNDGLVGVVMCGTRPGCAVIELFTFTGVKNIIERENTRKKFTVQDYTEAELGIRNDDDANNYTPHMDRLNVILNDINELQEQLSNEIQFLDQIPADLEEYDDSKLKFAENYLNMEVLSSGDDDDDDDEDYEDEEMTFVDE